MYNSNKMVDIAPSKYDVEISALRHIFNELNLSLNHMNVVLRENPSRQVPYHNNFHLVSVAVRAYDGANYYGLGMEKKRILVLAALYHDYGHAINMFPDSINIAIAVAKLASFPKEMDKTLTVDEIIRAAAVIGDSQFPHGPIEAKDVICSKILRDADILHSLDVNNGVRLSQETGLDITEAKTIKFLEKNLSTFWGKSLLERYIIEKDDK